MNIKSRSFKRFLKIDAAALQGVPDLANSNIETVDISLGTKDKKLFNIESQVENFKKFKFRVRSKHTGKVVDLNVKFRIRNNDPNENIPSCGDSGYVESNMPEAGTEDLHEGAGHDDSQNTEVWEH